jgi:hypothetical protein
VLRGAFWNDFSVPKNHSVEGFEEGSSIATTPDSLVRGRPGVTVLHCLGEDEEWVSEAHRLARGDAAGSCPEEEVTRKVVGNRPQSALCPLPTRSQISTKSSRPPC